MKLQLIEGEHESICENGNLLPSSQTASESVALSCSQDDCGPFFEEKKSVKDNCWSWVICATAFCDLFIVLGTHYSFGILYSALLDKFGESKAATAWVGSLGQFTVFFMCYPASILSAKYGCRAVTILGGIFTSLGLFLSSFANKIEIIYFTHGIIFGIGSGFSYLPALVMVANYFDKKRSFATGIATAGSNLGALSLAPLQQILVSQVGWRNCYRFLGGLSMLIMVCGILFRPPPRADSKNSETKKQCSEAHSDELKSKESSKHCRFPTNKKFIIWLVASTVACFGYFVPHVNLVRYGQERGNTYQDSSLLISYFSVSSCCGKIVFGRVSDIPWVNTLLLYIICMFMSGLSSLIAIFSENYSMLVLYSVILGICDGSFSGLMSIVTFECSGGENKSQAWGAALMCMALSMLVGSPFAGWVGDKTGQYRNVFYLAGGPMFLGGLILLSTFYVNDPVCDRTTRKSRITLSSDTSSTLCIYDMITVL